MPYKDPEKRRACQRRYRQKHREEILAYEHRTREKRLDYMRQYNLERREKKLAYMRYRYEANQEEQLAYQRRYREENPEKVAAYKHRWNQKNPEKRVASDARRRARKQSSPDTLTSEQAEHLIGIGQAMYPGEKLHLDHIVPLSKGGGTTLANMQAIPARLNCSKHDALPEEVYEQGAFL